jgi:hypothetical protein
MNPIIHIEYNGKYPRLCLGEFVVVLNGTRWEFPQSALRSGGTVSFTADGNEVVTTGPWTVSVWPKGFPAEHKAAVEAAVNAKIPWGCCSGCVKPFVVFNINRGRT